MIMHNQRSVYPIYSSDGVLNKILSCNQSHLSSSCKKKKTQTGFSQEYLDCLAAWVAHYSCLRNPVDLCGGDMGDIKR